MLGQEHARNTDQEAYLFKVDNKKAYSRVLHNFLSDVLMAIGFDPLLINPIKGLVMNATLKFMSMDFSQMKSIYRGEPDKGTHWTLSFFPDYSTLHATSGAEED